MEGGDFIRPLTHCLCVPSSYENVESGCITRPFWSFDRPLFQIWMYIIWLLVICPAVIVFFDYGVYTFSHVSLPFSFLIKNLFIKKKV